VETKQIMVALTAGDSPALGNIWRITAKKTDFYLDPLGQAGTAAHLSVHGSNERFDGHRFHIKVDRGLAATAKDRGHFVGHGVPWKGFAFDGQQLAARAFREARIRWTWDLQRPRFRAAAVSGTAPELADHQSGARLSEVLSPNDAWDIDLVVSYDQPYCVFSELPGVAAAQKPSRARRRPTTLTGMSLSVGHDGCDLDPGATESGHPVPNGSPSFPSLPLIDTSP
jgi:hypothetical protein